MKTKLLVTRVECDHEFDYGGAIYPSTLEVEAKGYGVILVWQPRDNSLQVGDEVFVTIEKSWDTTTSSS